MPSDEDLEPTLPAWEEEITDSSPTVTVRRDMSATPPDLGDKFEVLGFVGRGGMGAVYRVRHKQLDHVRAVKVLPSAADPLMVQRLRREASIATGLTHPNIVTVYDLETLDDGSLAIVMEYLEGEDLNVHVVRNGRLSADELRERFRPVADALDRMHAAGVVHRDIKPANLFVCNDGTIKILDFGVSRLMETDSGLTQTGGIVGTPSTMAPEQIEGEPITAATDIYSLGVALFFCLTGHKPFRGRTQIETISKVLAGDPPRADELCDDVPTHVANALDRAMARETGDRWPTATALIDAMESEETRAFRVSHKVKRRRRKVRNALVAAVGLVVAVVAGAVLVPPLFAERDSAPVDAGTGPMDVAVVEPTRGGTIRAGITARFNSLDPMIAHTDNFTYVQYLLYDALLDVDWRGELMPGLAERWDVLDGERRFVFHLRDDAILHDDPCLPDGRGHPIDAVDVQRSLERVFTYIATDDDTTWGFLPLPVGFDEYLQGRNDHPTGLAILDDRTVEVTFAQAAPSFLHCLRRPLWSIVAAEAIDTYGPRDIGFRSVGSGPFFAAADATDVHVVLKRHEHAWQSDADHRPLPHVDTIEIETYNGSDHALTALREGRVDIALRLPTDAIDDAMIIDGLVARPRENWEGFVAPGYLDEAHAYLWMMVFDKTSDEPYAHDTRVRQAVSLSIRRDELAEAPWIASHTPLVDGMLGFEPSTETGDDSVRARQLLSEAGYPGGEGLPPITICSLATAQQDADRISDNLAEVGVRAPVKVASHSTWLLYLKEGGCDLVFARYDDMVLDDDPTAVLVGLASRARLHEREPAVPGVITGLSAAEDRRERATLLRQLAIGLVEDANIVFLAYRDPGAPVFATLASHRIRGLAAENTGLLNPRRQRIREMWLSQDD